MDFDLKQFELEQTNSTSIAFSDESIALSSMLSVGHSIKQYQTTEKETQRTETEEGLDEAKLAEQQEPQENKQIKKSKFLPFSEFQKEVKEAYENRTEEDKKKGINAWYNNELAKHPGWPSHPDQKYKDCGWMSWYEIVGLKSRRIRKRDKTIEILPFSEFQKEVREANDNRSGEDKKKGLNAWYKDEWPKHSGWPGNPGQTYKDKGWCGLLQLVGIEPRQKQKRERDTYIEFLPYPEFQKQVKEAYDLVHLDKKKNIRVWYNDEWPKHPDWPCNPYQVYAGKGWPGGLRQLVGLEPKRKIVEYLPYPEFQKQVKEAYDNRTDEDKKKGIDAWYKDEYLKHPDWPCNPYQVYAGKGWPGGLRALLGLVDLRTLKQSLNQDLQDLSKEGFEQENFSKMLSLFGSTSATDILYLMHPDYTELLPEYVKKQIGQYLGDYLLEKSGRVDFNIKDVKDHTQWLANDNLKQGLITVLKNDALSFYNSVLVTDDYSIDKSKDILDFYFDCINRDVSEFATADLLDAINEAQAFYDGLFNLRLPENLKESLSGDRLFPDINQRINIFKIADQKRMLIADEMGLGKSASAIFTKEIYVKDEPALVVVPSNVIATWQAYLSDETRGYFKDGQAPNVLTIDATESLKDIELSNYDYVLISHERLNKRTTESLVSVGFKMLIIDEVHKLKNIGGVRANNLIDIADSIQPMTNEAGVPNNDGYVVAISGTPVPNKVSDVAMSLKLLYPNIFTGKKISDLTSEVIKQDILQLRYMLTTRMEMKNLADSIAMPKLNEVVVPIKLNAQEKLVYELLLQEDELTATQKIEAMRQFLLNTKTVRSSLDFRSSKIIALNNDLEHIFASKQKVIMFVNDYINGIIRGDANLLEDLKLPDGVDIRIVDGSTSTSDRELIQKEVQYGRGKLLVVVSGKTADVGVDYSGAQHVIMYNEPWTKYDKAQQISRVHRPRPGLDLSTDLGVTTYITEGTLEEGIHDYIERKYRAVEKLLRGIPLSELDQHVLRSAERKQEIDNLEVNGNFARAYIADNNQLLNMFGSAYQAGEEAVLNALREQDHSGGDNYADRYRAFSRLSYQANVARLSGAIINELVSTSRQDKSNLLIADVASGPEMLKMHAPDNISPRVVSLDLNKAHFKDSLGGMALCGSMVTIPLRDESLDYANLSLALHYTKDPKSRSDGRSERAKVFIELNRILKTGGKAIVTLPYSMKLANAEAFEQTMADFGFAIDEEYSGETNHQSGFSCNVIVLTKQSIVSADILENSNFRSLKITKTNKRIHDSKEIIRNVDINGRIIDMPLNTEDYALQQLKLQFNNYMNTLVTCYGALDKIPNSIIKDSKLCRIKIGKKWKVYNFLPNGMGYMYFG